MDKILHYLIRTLNYGNDIFLMGNARCITTTVPVAFTGIGTKSGTAPCAGPSARGPGRSLQAAAEAPL